MFKSLAAAFLTVAALATGPAHAATRDGPITTGEFLAHCDSGVEWERLVCMTYAAAIADTFVSLSISALNPDRPDIIEFAGACLPIRLRFGADNIISYARSAVDGKFGDAMRNLSPAMASMAGLRGAYPCAKG
jgi:hypothetical protein